MTHTVAKLEVSSAVFSEIAALLLEAKYDHCFIDGGVIDMSGIGIVPRVLTGRKCGFFGCTRMKETDQAGHYLYGLDEKTLPRELQYGHLDSRFAPARSSQPQSLAKLTHFKGWTVVSMWDRTGDSRGNSNSSFIVDAIVSFEEVMVLARQHFPDLVARIEKAAPITLGEV